MPFNTSIIYMYVFKKDLFLQEKNKDIFVQNEYFFRLKRGKGLILQNSMISSF